MTLTAVMDNNFTLPDNGPGSIPSLRHWMQGFVLQTLVYGINIVLFFMAIWGLVIHILKASHTHKFHRLHLLQNCVLTVYTIVMFALSSIYMGRQGLMADGAWHGVFENGGVVGVVESILGIKVAPTRMCSVASVLVNWGTVGIFLWRCTIYWKVRGNFPLKAMALPYLLFATSIATNLLNLLQESAPLSLSAATRSKDWRLISWSVSTALYYLLSFLVSVRNIYRRRVMQKEIGDGVYRFMSNLTIFNESGAILLVFATAYLISLARFPNLIYIFQAMMTQIQVMTYLIVVQRVTGGKAWSGKIVDCVLLQQEGHHRQEVVKEDVSAIGFNPNPQVSYAQDDYESSNSGSQIDKTHQEHHRDVTLELRMVENKA